MIDRDHKLPVTTQCQILRLVRSTAYYQSESVSPGDLALMRRIDELHLEHPFAGSRMLRDLLVQDGTRVAPYVRLVVAPIESKPWGDNEDKKWLDTDRPSRTKQ